MFTSSIERRADCSRSNGASATSSSPAARSSSSSARSVTPSRAGELFEIGQREARQRNAARDAPRPRLTRSIAAARLAGVPDDAHLAGRRRQRHRRRRGRPTRRRRARTSCAAPWRRRRSSSASIPRLMMSWLAASVVSSASETVMPDRRSYQDSRVWLRQDTTARTDAEDHATPSASTQPSTQTATARAVLW